MMKTFLAMGGWSRVQPGLTRQQVVAQLGWPQTWMFSNTERGAKQRGEPQPGWVWSPLLRYGAVEFHFGVDPNDICWMIFCDDLDRISTPFHPNWLSEGMLLRDVCGYLDEAGLRWERRPFRPDPDQIRLILDSGVHLGFSKNQDFFHGPGRGHRLFCVERQI
ncbi:MAG: hypothetical protein AAFV53_19185 [Myxococcota bacterium]